MKCVVTGAAGFIGSHLCEELLRRGDEVVGVDAFIDYYDPAVKRRNLAGLDGRPGFQFHSLDLRTDPLDDVLAGTEVVFHVAAQAGLVKSWTDFDGYWTCNVQATQRLLEAVRRTAPGLRRLLYVSTSSVYGRFGNGDETLPTRPISPYGVTKLAGEHLCQAYADAHDLPLVVLRYFSVYGPRQRPDMGYHRFIQAALLGRPVDVYGDGQQVRGNTYVADCVAATLAAVNALPGEIYNVGGGETASVWDILHRLEELAGAPIPFRQEPARPGDQRYTLADTGKLRRHLGWEPCTTLQQGLRAQWDWQKSELAHGSPTA
ncbi:MAG: NAD-dependent epimerase/dehydratase family protein [Planctomycetes bacterium]|nr:NAD-dependent epimerase/dehydratase family protein [Planctomycetota bacterium]